MLAVLCTVIALTYLLRHWRVTWVTSASIYLDGRYFLQTALGLTSYYYWVETGADPLSLYGSLYSIDGVVCVQAGQCEGNAQAQIVPFAVEGYSQWVWSASTRKIGLLSVFYWEPKRCFQGYSFRHLHSRDICLSQDDSHLLGVSVLWAAVFKYLGKLLLQSIYFSAL